MKKTIKSLVALLLAMMMLASCGQAPVDDGSVSTLDDAPISDAVVTEEPVVEEILVEPVNKFIHVEGNQIIDGNGNPIWLKGAALGNNVWVYPTEPTWTCQTEESYADLASMGFNSVRFYMNYQVFEDDTDPYVYKESGFEWVDQNIEWAKKHGIGIVLNMHVPQGGYQSQGNGTELWTDDGESRKRLVALWEEFAKRYSDEETIIGYGLLNEPIVPNIGTVEESVDQCRAIMQEITDAIRKHDTNHIVFIERALSVQDPNTGNSDWALTPDQCQFLIDDDNAVYEFHFYEPYSFTHQDMGWAGTTGNIQTYPLTSLQSYDQVTNWTGSITSTSTEVLDDGWELYVSEPATLTDDRNIGYITLYSSATGSNGTSFFDDVILEIYQDGLLVDTNTYEFGNSQIYSTESTKGRGFVSPKGIDGNCYGIWGTNAEATVSGFQFLLEEGCEYVLKAKVKKDGDIETAMPRLDFTYYDNITTMGFDTIKPSLMSNIQFGIDNNVPMYMGEFGAAITACIDDRDGEVWVADILDFCKEYNIHFSYHTYHDETFGLYQTRATELPDNRNDELAQVFIDKLAE